MCLTINSMSRLTNPGQGSINHVTTKLKVHGKILFMPKMILRPKLTISLYGIDETSKNYHLWKLQ